MKQASLGCIVFIFALSLLLTYNQSLILAAFVFRIKQDMFYRTKVEKWPTGLKDKNNENINKKKKKNRNISPINATDRQIQYKQGYGLNHKKADATERSQEKSKEKIVNKAATSHKQENKVKKTSKKLNNSPIRQQKKNSNPSQKQNSHSRSKEKSPSTSRKNTTKVKAYEQQPLQATKRQLFYNTQKKSKSKSPIPKQKAKSKEKKSAQIKIQQSNSKQVKKLNCFTTPIKTQPVQNIMKTGHNEQIQFQQYLSPKAKLKKSIPQIRTEFSARKKSFIDQSLLLKLEYHKSNKKIDYIENCLLRSVQKQEKVQPTHPRYISNEQSTEVLKFKRQQQQKWHWMLQQIKNLKNQNQIQNKIDLLIKQITQNYHTLQKKANIQQQLAKEQPQNIQPLQQQLLLQQYNEMQQLVVQPNNETYSIVSMGFDNNTSKVQQISVHIQYKNPEKQQSRSHMISLEDFFHSTDYKNSRNFKRQLFQQTINKQEQPSPINIKNNIEKQLILKDEGENQLHIVQSIEQDSESYLEQLLMKQKPSQMQPSKEQANKEVSPAKSYQIEIAHIIQCDLVNEFCEILLRNKKLLHYFLIHFDQPQHRTILPHQGQHYEQPSSNIYTLDIVNKLLDYLFTNYRQYLFTQISYYYECKPLQILRYVRSNFEQESQQLNYEIQNQNQIEIPFFNLDKIYQFQTQVLKNEKYSPSTLNLNYFNQCIYDSFNDIIDNIRPYGSKGKPIFTLRLSHCLTTQQAVRNTITNKFKQIFEYEWDGQLINDNLIHGEQGNFEIVYFLCLEITELIYNQSVVEINKVRRRRQFYYQ